MTVGVTKINSSLSVLLMLVLRKNCPMIGRSPRIGYLISCVWSFFCTRPPRTIVSPFLTRATTFSVWLKMFGVWVPSAAVVNDAIVLYCGFKYIVIVPSRLMRGATLNCVVTLIG